MSRYFFNSIDSSRVQDEDGLELADEAIARFEAVAYLGETLRQHPELAWTQRYVGVEVTNDQGDVTFTTITLTIDGPASTLTLT